MLKCLTVTNNLVVVKASRGLQEQSTGLEGKRGASGRGSSGSLAALGRELHMHRAPALLCEVPQTQGTGLPKVYMSLKRKVLTGNETAGRFPTPSSPALLTVASQPSGSGSPTYKTVFVVNEHPGCCYLGILVSIHLPVHAGLKPEGHVSRFKGDRLRCEQKSWRQHGLHSLSLLDKYSHIHSIFLIFSFLAALDGSHPEAGRQLGEIPMPFSSGDPCSEIEMKQESR